MYRLIYKLPKIKPSDTVKAVPHPAPSIKDTGRMPRTTNTILEATSTLEVLHYLVKRHKVGLLETAAIGLLVYIISDKLITVFG